MKAPTAILTADIHLRDVSPVCRTDDFKAAQTSKVLWVRGLQEKYACPVLDAGDLFHHWRPSNFLLSEAMVILPRNMITVPGNHELPNHNLELLQNSGLGVLNVAGSLNILTNSDRTYVNDVSRLRGFPWGVEPQPTTKGKLFEVAICHYMTYVGRSPYPGCTAPGAHQLLKRLTGYDLVLTGHNHKTFVVEQDGRLLVNPGSLTRQSSDQADHKPCVFLWYAEERRVEQVFYPGLAEGVVSRDHIQKTEDKDERIDAFVERLSGEFEIGLSFEKNMERFFESNRVRRGSKDLVWRCVHGNAKK